MVFILITAGSCELPILGVSDGVGRAVEAVFQGSFLTFLGVSEKRHVKQERRDSSVRGIS